MKGDNHVKKLIAFCLMFCVGAISAMPLDVGVVLEENQEEDAKREAAIKAEIEQMELGQKVKLKLIPDQEIKGKIQSIASDSFTISNAETSQIEKILFSDVTEIKKEEKEKKALLKIEIPLKIVKGAVYSITSIIGSPEFSIFKLPFIISDTYLSVKKDIVKYKKIKWVGFFQKIP